MIDAPAPGSWRANEQGCVKQAAGSRHLVRGSRCCHHTDGHDSDVLAVGSHLGPLCVPSSLVSTLPHSCSFFSHSESDVKQLWLQLKKDEPHLLSNFEDFLTRIFLQLQEAHEEKNELECALKKWVPVSDA